VVGSIGEALRYTYNLDFGVVGNVRGFVVVGNVTGFVVVGNVRGSVVVDKVGWCIVSNIANLEGSENCLSYWVYLLVNRPR